MEHYWSRRAARLAVRVNVATALALAAPRVAGLALIAAGVVVGARRAAVAEATVGAAVLGVLAVAIVWVAAKLWPRRYRVADAYSRLDFELGLGGGLVAAREGAVRWPPRTDARCRTGWRLGRVTPALLGGPAVLVAAMLVPIAPAKISAPRPAGQPLVWGHVEDGLEILEQEPLVDPAALDRWQDQLQELRALPDEAWFSHESKEAADSLWEQIRSTVARAEQTIEPVQRALETVERLDRGDDPASAQQQLQRALQQAAADGAALDPKLADKLARLDPKELPSLSADRLQQMQAALARAQAAGRRARRAGEGEGDGEGEGEGPGTGEVQRGPGTAPIELSGLESGRHGEGFERLDSHDDPARDALGDVVREDAVAPEVDLDRYSGAMRSPGTSHLGQGGQAVWTDRLMPDEQAILRKYFE